VIEHQNDAVNVNLVEVPAEVIVEQPKESEVASKIESEEVT
jgi:hypothetical protein